MFSDIANVRRLMLLLGDERFTDALTQAEKLVEDADETLDRAAQSEGRAERAVREANETPVAVDCRLGKVDESINPLEAKVGAGFSLGFFIFAANAYVDGNLFPAVGLGFTGLLGAGQLAATVTRIPRVEKLRADLRYPLERFDDDRGDDERDARRLGRPR
ncbi:MAG: hypothetical protein ABEJ05_14300 [Haloglomus sp.]